MLSVLRSFFSRDFEYSPFHRALEIAAIFGFFILVAIISVRVYSGIATLGWETVIWLLPVAIVGGYVLSDFASGVVHWLGDTYGTEQTPLLGEGFIKPFREHHVDPKGICRHDFIEVNGNNCIVLAIYMVPLALFVTDPTSMLQFFALATSVSLTLGVFMTNQFHKWSHMDDPPLYIRKLQDWKLILGRDHHGVHHTAPFDTYYCITCGWMNPVLQRLQFFENIEAALRKLFGVRTSRELEAEEAT